MNRAEWKISNKGELPESNSTTKCSNCDALFPLEYFECPQCDIDFHSFKVDFKF